MSESKRPLKVFLCHTSADKPKVRDLFGRLRSRGIRPWLDEIDLMGGQDWQVEVSKALATSDVIIICLTKNSIDKAGFVQKELKFALDKALEMPEGRIFLIPVRLEECEVPFSLSRYQWVDLFDKNGFSRLMKSLKMRAEQLERSPVEAPRLSEVDTKLNRTKLLVALISAFAILLASYWQFVWRPAHGETIVPTTASVSGSVCGGTPVKRALPQSPYDFNRQLGYTVYNTTNSYADPNQGLLSNTIRSVFVGQNGIWVGYGVSNSGEKGISFVSNPVETNRIWEMCLNSEGKPIGRLANSIMEETNGNVWVATDGDGVWKLQNGAWEQYMQDDLVVSNNLLPVKATYTVVGQGDNVLVGTLKGLIRYNGINWTKITSLEDGKVHTVAFARSGDTWVGFIDQGVRRIKPDGSFQDFNTSNSQLTNDNIRSIVVDKDEKIWIGMWGGGISIYDNGNWSSYRKDPKGLQSDNVNVLSQDRFGRIWAGTEGGTSYFDISTGTWKIYTDANTFAIGFGKSTRERCSFQDDPVWIGTNGQGLLNSRLPAPVSVIKNFIVSNLPVTVKAGDKLTPLVAVSLTHGYKLAGGDFLQTTESMEYTPSPTIAVDPSKLDADAQQFEFSFKDNPINVPQEPGEYKLVWRLWQCGRYVDPPIVLQFKVVNQ